MPFCSHCGERVPDEAVNCPGCGAPVAEASSGEQEGPPAQPALSIDPGMTAHIRQLARDGNKIQAIKEYREQTGASLKDAKDAVEHWMKAEGIVAAKGTGCATSVLVLLALVGAGLLRLV